MTRSTVKTSNATSSIADDSDHISKSGASSDDENINEHVCVENHDVAHPKDSHLFHSVRVGYSHEMHNKPDYI